MTAPTSIVKMEGVNRWVINPPSRPARVSEKKRAANAAFENWIEEASAAACGRQQEEFSTPRGGGRFSSVDRKSMRIIDKGPRVSDGTL